MLRYFKHDEKQKVPQVSNDVIKAPSLKVEKATTTSQSAQSSLTVGSDLGTNPALVAGREQNSQSYKCGMKGTNQVMAKAASEYQSSDCCSGISSVIDCDSVDTSSKTANVDDALGKIDVDRLKGAFQRTRRVKFTKNKVVVAGQSELESDLFIESELEKGVELEYMAAVKRQKVL